MATFLEELRAEAELLARNSTLDLPVPASRYVVRFRPPTDRDRLTGVVAAYRVGSALTADQERALIVDCCDEILRRNPDTGELEQPDPDGGPLRFDSGDARWGEKVKTARDCVAELYKLRQRPLAAAGVADAIIDWLQGLDDTALARVEGESDGGESSSATPPASTSTDSTD